MDQLNSFKNSLIIHEENTKKNHKRVVSLYVIEISLDLHKLNFAFLDLHLDNVFFENYFANALLDRWFLKQSACFIRANDTRLRLVSLYLIKHCCSCFK